MEPISTIRGRSIPLPLKNIDTDMIIPADFLTTVQREGLGQHLFQRLKASDPGFVLHGIPANSASILVAGENFGCGSSREHAVWAILDYGIKAVLAPSFSDIFAANAGNNGLLLGTVGTSDVAEICAEARKSIQGQQASEYTLEITLTSQTIASSAGKSYAFGIDPYTKYRLSEGLDDLAYLQGRLDKIEAFKKEQNIYLQTGV